MNRHVHRLDEVVFRIAAGIAVAVLLSACSRESAQPTAARARQADPRFSTSVLNEVLAQDLTERGFQVNPGYPMVYGNACKDYTYPALHSCFGNNPVAPYVIPVVKPWPGEFVGPTPVETFGAVERGYIPTYRLDPRDAIVIHGQMPPPGKYMSVTTYVWTQHGRWKEKDYERWATTPNHPPMPYVFSTIPPDEPNAGRVWSFSTLGDPVNNVVMEQRSGEPPFGKYRYFIITPSASTDRAVRDVLHARGVPDAEIFTEEIPRRDDVGPIGPLGMAENAIEFFTFFRYALPENRDEGAQWWNSFEPNDSPLQVLRVRAPSSVGPVERYDLLTYGERTAISEAPLGDDLRELVRAVCDRLGIAGLRSAGCAEPPPASSFMADLLHDFGWAGPYCRKVNMWCGDQTDAGLFGTGPLPLDSGEVHAVVATLATETGNATYVGLSVNNASTYLAPLGVVDTDLKGSADGYGNVNAPVKFFVHFFTRDCAALDDVLTLERLQRDCTEITEAMVPAQGSTTGAGDPALFGLFWPGIRDYIAPGTARGPDTTKLLTPRILTFTPR